MGVNQIDSKLLGITNVKLKIGLGIRVAGSGSDRVLLGPDLSDLNV